MENIYIIIAILVIQFIVKRVVQANKAQQELQAGGDIQSLSVSPTQLQEQDLGEYLKRHQEGLREAQLRGQALERQLAGLKGPGLTIRQALHRPTLEEISQSLRLLSRAESNPEEIFSLPESVWEALPLALARIGALEQLSQFHRDPRLSQLINDAEHIAEDMINPIRRFALSRGFDFPRLQPICGPVEPEHQAVLMGLLPGHPLLFVPDDFTEDLLWWPAMAHEIGHLLSLQIPSFKQAILGGLPPSGGQPWLPRLQGQQVVLDMAAILERWLPEIAADTLGAMLLGPAALRGAIQAFSEEEDPEWQRADGHYVAEHPAPELRIRYLVRVLGRMGFKGPSAEILKRWETLHGDPAHIILPSLFGQDVPIEKNFLLQQMDQIAELLMGEGFQGIGGYPLSAIHGLNLSPGVWSQVEKNAKTLQDSQSIKAPPRLVLAAAVEAAGRQSGGRAALAHGLHRALWGQKKQQGSQSGMSRSEAASLQREIRDALILRAVLHRE